MKNKTIRLIAGSALSIAFVLSTACITRADVKDQCHRRLESDRARIDHDAAKHGQHSREVKKDVRHMDSDRQWCRDHHADWDHSRFDVGIYIGH
ncbi:MAG: hypothetical protein WBQ34_18130 [Candidatus Acidiferrales bacterium]